DSKLHYSPITQIYLLLNYQIIPAKFTNLPIYQFILACRCCVSRYRQIACWLLRLPAVETALPALVPERARALPAAPAGPVACTHGPPEQVAAPGANPPEQKTEAHPRSANVADAMVHHQLCDSPAADDRHGNGPRQPDAGHRSSAPAGVPLASACHLHP